MHATRLVVGVVEHDPLDIANAPNRIYRREWKRNKPHLAKSTSLPVLQLIPPNRPLFLCRQCGFINTLIPLCLWCLWTSPDAHQEFEESMPRRRRVTAPPRVFWKQVAFPTYPSGNISPSAETKQPCTSTSSRNPAFKEHTKLQVPPDTQDAFSSPGSGRRYPAWTQHRGQIRLDPPLKSTLGSKMSVVLHDGDKATLPSPSPAFDKSREMNWSHEHEEKFQSLSLNDTHDQIWLSKGVDRSTKSLQVLKTISTKSLRSPHLIIDLKAVQDPYDLVKPVESPPSPGSPRSHRPTKTLRRKKRFSAPRPSTAAGLVTAGTSTPASASGSPVAERPQPAAYLDTQSMAASVRHRLNDRRYTHEGSNSQPINNAPRLGHPNRPYYTAIRPNMSRPTSPTPPPTHTNIEARAPSRISLSSRPISMPSPSRPGSPGIYSLLSSTSAPTGSPVFLEDDDDQEEPIPRSSFSGLLSVVSLSGRHDRSKMTSNRHRPSAVAGFMPGHHQPSGFSLSGETELRMALARGQNTGSGGVGNDDFTEFGVARDAFRFRDMSKHETKVMQKVNAWKRGFKQLVKKKMPG